MTPAQQVVHRVITRFVLGQAGLKADEADSGAVTLIQRFGSAASQIEAEGTGSRLSITVASVASASNTKGAGITGLSVLSAWTMRPGRWGLSKPATAGREVLKLCGAT